jgi:glycosyltransferase involved in cell wall biosynthesis
MRVAFNGWFLQRPQTGTGRYVYNLLRSLGRVDGVNEYRIFCPRDLDAKPDTPSTFKWEITPVRRLGASENLEKLVWEQRTFPAAAKRTDARVLHVPHFAPPARSQGIPTIVTIHDVINLRLPMYRASPGAQLYGRLVQGAARHAALIITVSEFSKGEILTTVGVPEERVRVVREAPAPQYRRVTDPERLQAVCQKYGVGERFVLNVGGLDARKNVASLVGAFAAVYHQLGDPGLRLFIAGDPTRLGGPLFPDWRPLAARLSVLDAILCAPVAEEDLPALYSAAVCFAYASLYEGFGLTPLEAMACGAPVVCSHATSLPEVVGNAGILVNAEDPDAFGGAIYRVLTLAPLREDLRARGLVRVKLFSWDQAAVETSALYAEVGGTSQE